MYSIVNAVLDFYALLFPEHLRQLNICNIIIIITFIKASTNIHKTKTITMINIYIYEK